MAIAYSTGLAGSDTSATSTGMEIGPITISDTGTVIVGFVSAGVANLTFFSGMFWDSTTLNSTFTQIVSDSAATGRSYRAFYLTNPTAGTHSVRVAYTANAAPMAAVVGVYTGIDDSGAVDTATISTGMGDSTGVASTAIPSATGDLVIGFCGVQSESTGSIVAGDGGTDRVDGEADASGNLIGVALADWAGAATVASSFSWGNPSHEYGTVSFNINAGAGGGGGGGSVRLRHRTLLGVGG